MINLRLKNLDLNNLFTKTCYQLAVFVVFDTDTVIDRFSRPLSRNCRHADATVYSIQSDIFETFVISKIVSWTYRYSNNFPISLIIEIQRQTLCLIKYWIGSIFGLVIGCTVPFYFLLADPSLHCWGIFFAIWIYILLYILDLYYSIIIKYGLCLSWIL